jgi:hypothetical protein
MSGGRIMRQFARRGRPPGAGVEDASRRVGCLAEALRIAEASRSATGREVIE